MNKTAASLNDLPSASFHQLAEIVGQASQNPSVVQIGAMDGVLFDMLNPHLVLGGWAGLLVEPMPDMFATLQKTYLAFPDLKLANCAVGDHDGTMTLTRIDPAAIAEGRLPQQALGITTGLPERGFLAHAETAERYAPYMMEVEVPCLTLPSLFDEHKIGKIDLMVIDTEGADWIIARQLDLERYSPALLCIEYSHLKYAEIEDCFAWMTASGYGFGVCREDPENMLFYKNQPLAAH